jgi:hypothetical protein
MTASFMSPSRRESAPEHESAVTDKKRRENMEIRKEDIQFVHGGKGEKMDASISFGCSDECVGGTASRKAMQETN